ncbi:hypothetical protein C882_2363 [Caenispirillum salinarum AK4]|uniref:Phasin domain-containing protein n=1 Tax=Caenispirillum salinarum AK4 TaxID=1238182 RepID=K9HVM5_9PROT|nr:phasin family protein [Caenispirillum salinarum]EKV32286.1 hypothetical protein C882_2363 [Caenispirillum salinarum AK4]
MADDAVKTQQKQADRAQQVTNEAETKMIEAGKHLRTEGFEIVQHGFRRWQEAQFEMMRAGSDIMLLQMDAMSKLSGVRKPEDAVAVSQDAMQAVQARMTEYMQRSADLAARQMQDMTEAFGARA